MLINYPWWWLWWLFPRVRGFLWKCLTIHSPPAFFFFFYVETRSRTLISLRRPGSVHSGSASWDDCGRVLPDELRVSSFPTLCLDSGIVSSLRFRWVKDVCVFRCNLPPALLTEWPGSFTCHCRNMGMEWGSAHKVNSEEVHSPIAPAGTWTCNLSILSLPLSPTSYPGPWRTDSTEINDWHWRSSHPGGLIALKLMIDTDGHLILEDW